MKKWEIWDLDQEAARTRTDPSQPLDPKRSTRPYLIISDNAALTHAGPESKIICHPIGERQISSLFDVALTKGQAGCTKDCFVWCHEIYTLKRKYFVALRGNASFLGEDVKKRQRRLLDLR
jgi:hypothetical protein